MENTHNTNIIKSDEVTVNNEIKKKRGRAKKQLTEEEIKEKAEKQRAYLKAHYEKKKNTEEYKEKNRQHAKEQYNKDKGKVIARVRLNQQRIKDVSQLERLHALKEKGLITFNFACVSKEDLLSNLQILGEC